MPSPKSRMTQRRLEEIEESRGFIVYLRNYLDHLDELLAKGEIRGRKVYGVGTIIYHATLDVRDAALRYGIDLEKVCGSP